jgi:FKBP-type peptidyl-prolyl cis-trans isomerase FkpA
MMMRRPLQILGVILAVAGLAAGAACGSPTAPSVNVPFSQTDTVVGTGATAASGHQVSVSYTGWLYDATKSDHKGAQFDSNGAFTFTLGNGSVIAGWDQGVPGMKVGGTRVLVIPPSLGYGSKANGSIPANSTLIFEITLIGAL